MKAVKFGDLFEFIRNGMSVKQDKSGAGLPISRIETIWNSSIDPERVGFAGLEESDCRPWLLSPGDILFSHINSVEHIGKCAVYSGTPEKLVHGMNLLCLRSKKDALAPEYAKHLIRSAGFRGQLSSFINKAVNQASVSIANLKNIEVRIPPLSEQQRIAAILDKADTLRSKRREALAQLNRIAQAIFVGMFGSDSNGQTREVLLDEVVVLITKGTTPTTLGMDFVESGIPFVRVQNLVAGSVDWKSEILYIDESTHDKLARSRISPGDVLLSIAGTIGRAAVVPESAPSMNCNQAVALIRVDRHRIAPQFLRFWLGGADAQRQIREGMVTGTITNLSLGQIRNLRITVPTMEKQVEFLRRLTTLSALEARYRETEGCQEALVSSLQTYAFRGEL